MTQKSLDKRKGVIKPAGIWKVYPDKKESRELKIKIGNKWIDCLVIGDLTDVANNFFAIKAIDVPESAIKFFTKKL